jgi:Rps23 Pro-64 3,4-dihydroxylase Tpa1-like proline 4-hydroxylase
MVRERGVFLPFCAIPDWLPADAADALLDHAVREEPHYTPGRVLYEGETMTAPDLRRTDCLASLGPFQDLVSARALEQKPALEAAFGMVPFTAHHVEIELAAHGDGAHFDRHVDTFVRRKRPTTRLLTLVLYLNRRPQAFRGGALRMHALGSPAVRDIAPSHNLLVAFPSFLPHSVRRVECPGNRFADRRFAINMWIHG